MKLHIGLLIIAVLSFYNLHAQNIECIGNTIEIPLTGSRNESVQWQFSTNEVNWINLPSADSDTLVYNIIETGYFRTKVIYGDCEYFSDTTYIVAYPEPTIANAGTDQNIINGSTTISLNANVPIAGTGYWSIKSGTSGSFADSTASNTIFTGVLDNKYVLTWTISSECKSSVDEVNINIYNPSKIVLDYEGNIYKIVEIGFQIWMAENLKTTRYKDGLAIPKVESNLAWVSLATPGYCWADNDTAVYKDTYGALYNWYTVNTSRLCPTDWHVPSDSDWKTLEMFLGLTQTEANADSWRGTDQGSQLKNTSGWGYGNGTNTSGFSALPGGSRDSYGGYFNIIGSDGFWWSSTESEYNTSIAIFRSLSNTTGKVFRSAYPKQNGFSVRCVKDDLPVVTTIQPTDIISTSFTSGGNVISDGGVPVTARGVCWSTSPNPTTSSSKTTDGTGTGTFISSISGLTPGTTYYVLAYATNSAGTAYGSEISFTTLNSNQVTDIDGNVYNTVVIGTQTWMAENLAYLPSVYPSSSGSKSSARYYVNGYQGTNIADAKATANFQTYGVLYNWTAASNACPTGWHLPSSTEFATLSAFLGGENVAGGKLKEVGTVNWAFPNTGATNETGFTALPGGVRTVIGTFSGNSISSHYWSSTLINAYPTYWGQSLIYNDSNFLPDDFNSDHGLSVRCIKD